MEPIDWCRGRLLVRGNPLTASLPFAPAEIHDQILSVRAVITEIASVPGSISEPEVGLTKLEWWRRAIDERLPHPAVEALAASGAADRINADSVQSLIDGVTLTLENPRFENREQAWQFCRKVGGPAAMLEADLVGASPQLGERLQTLGAGGYLIRLVRDLAIDARDNRWLVPLDIQAEYQVSRRDALDKKASGGWNGMVRAWLADGLKRTDRALDEITADDAWRHRHLLIQHALDRRLAAKLARRPEKILTRRILPGQPGNAWCAWRTARQLRRRAGAESWEPG